MKGVLESLVRRPFLLFSVAAVWMNLEAMILGPGSFVQLHEWAEGILPMFLEASSRFFRDGLGQWMSLQACGVDRLTQGVYHLNCTALLFVLLPGWVANAAVGWIQTFMAGYFSYLLARDDFGMEGLAAAYAGLAAAFCLDQTQCYLGAFALWPSTLWMLGRLPDMGVGRGFLAAMGIGVLHASAAFVATTLPFTLVATAAWFVVVRPKTSAVFWLQTVVFAGTAGALHYPVFVSLAANAPLSQRSGRWTGVPSPGVWHQALKGLRLLFNDPISLALLAWGWFSSRGTPRPGKDCWRIATGLIVLSAGLALINILESVLAPHLGFLRGYQFGRFLKLAPLFYALLGAWGLMLMPRPLPAFTAAMSVLLAMTIMIKVRLVPEWFFGGSYAANFSSPVLRDLASRRDEGPFRVATFLHGLNPTYAQAYGLETTDAHVGLLPASYQRFWEAVVGPALAEMPGFRPAFREGNRLYLYFDNADLWPDGIPFDRFYRLNMLSLANTRFILSRHPLLHPELVPVRSAPLWKDLSRKEHVLVRLKENFLGKSYFFIYENRSCLPRAFLARRSRVFASEEDLWSVMSQAKAAELRETVFLLPGDAEALLEPKRAQKRGPSIFPGESEVRGLILGRDRLELTARSGEPAILVVANSFSPYWRCEVDGRPARVFRADGTFWGVRIEPGEHRVVFTYEPPQMGFSLRLGRGT